MQLNKEFIINHKNQNRYAEAAELNNYPEKVIQFGEGNFLRAFVDWHFNELNKRNLFNGKIVIVQPLKSGLVDLLNQQDGLYTLLLRGIQNGRQVEKAEIISSVSRGINPYSDYADFLRCAANPDLRFMVSNTTEAGIAYLQTEYPADECPDSFPAKVAIFLYERFKYFIGAADKGMIIIPCELIEDNGTTLKKYVLRHAEDWNLEKEFIDWVEKSNYFFNTLVDRIVPGYPKDEIEAVTEKLKYEDKLVVSAEIFHQWVIKGDEKVNDELPFTKAGLNVIWTDDITPYRTLKVRILNGSHTMFTIPSYLAGNDTVKESVEGNLTGELIKEGLFNEILPTLKIDEDKKNKFADAIIERFQNPFIKHYLLSITLNSISKFKVRVLPSLLKYHEQNNSVPEVLSFSLAALIVFYLKNIPMNGRKYSVNDDEEVINYFDNLNDEEDAKKIVNKVLANEKFWDKNLNEVDGLTQKVTEYYNQILTGGIKTTIENILKNKNAA